MGKVQVLNIIKMHFDVAVLYCTTENYLKITVLLHKRSEICFEK